MSHRKSHTHETTNKSDTKFEYQTYSFRVRAHYDTTFHYQENISSLAVTHLLGLFGSAIRTEL